MLFDLVSLEFGSGDEISFTKSHSFAFNERRPGFMAIPDRRYPSELRNQLACTEMVQTSIVTKVNRRHA